MTDQQLTARTDVDLAKPSILSRRSPWRYVMLLVGLAILVLLPYQIYPPVARQASRTPPPKIKVWTCCGRIAGW